MPMAADEADNQVIPTPSARQRTFTTRFCDAPVWRQDDRAHAAPGSTFTQGHYAKAFVPSGSRD